MCLQYWSLHLSQGTPHGRGVQAQVSGQPAPGEVTGQAVPRHAGDRALPPDSGQRLPWDSDPCHLEVSHWTPPTHPEPPLFPAPLWLLFVLRYCVGPEICGVILLGCKNCRTAGPPRLLMPVLRPDKTEPAGHGCCCCLASLDISLDRGTVPATTVAPTWHRGNTLSYRTAPWFWVSKTKLRKMTNARVQ